MLSFDMSRLVPAGLSVDGVEDGEAGVIIATHLASSARGRCPGCGTLSARIHSRYERKLNDLPIGGRRVELVVRARRFFCDAPTCARLTFAERFDGVAAPKARRTCRLEEIVVCLAIALGGRPAAALAQRIEVKVSNDTLLRAVRRRGSPQPSPPSVIGIDDWAWRRNFRYGTLVCDLERRKTIALLPDREPSTVEQWLRQWRDITVIARDRGGAYALAAQRAQPGAVQVADRWHLMENASAAFLDAVRKSMRPIRAAIGAATINPALLTSAERLQYEGYLRREEINASILAMAESGASIKNIRRKTGYSRKLIRAVLRGQRSDIFRTRQSSLEPWLLWLDEQWAAGRRNGSELWRDIRQRGFRGSLRVVGEWAGRRRRADKTDSALGHAPAARTIARLLTTGRDHLTRAETMTVAAIESGVALLTEARDVIADFQNIIRGKATTELDAWLDRASGSLVAAFANGMTKDKAAVVAAIASPWSNGQTEGQICKLKLVKRQMYGRGKIDLLQARVIGMS
jgi:transposase